MGFPRGRLPFLRRCHHQAAVGGVVNQSKVYELRTYNIWPQCVKDFLSLTSEEFHLRTSQSKLVGYWTCELGGLNHVFHIWEYGIFLFNKFLCTLLIINFPIQIALNIEHKFVQNLLVILNGSIVTFLRFYLG